MVVGGFWGEFRRSCKESANIDIGRENMKPIKIDDPVVICSRSGKKGVYFVKYK